MFIPEITESQLQLMRDTSNVPVFSQTEPSPNDAIDVAFTIAKAGADVTYLESLGLLREITEQHREHIDKVNKDSGRIWHVYEITEVGRGMFGTKAGTA